MMKVATELAVHVWTCVYVFQASLFLLTTVHASSAATDGSTKPPVSYIPTDNGYFPDLKHDGGGALVSRNEPSERRNRINLNTDRTATAMRLHGIENVLNNYGPFLPRADTIIDSPDKAVSSLDKTLAASHTNRHSQSGLRHPKRPSTEPIRDSIKKTIKETTGETSLVSDHAMKAGNVEREPSPHRTRRSIKAEINIPVEYTPTTHRRQYRGARASVADRIAHGFGKRGNAGDDAGYGLGGIEDTKHALVSLRGQLNTNIDTIDSENFTDYVEALLRLLGRYSGNDARPNRMSSPVGYSILDEKDEPILTLYKKIMGMRGERYQGAILETPYEDARFQ